MYNTIKFQIVRDNIAMVTINRPEALNALNSTVIGELEDVVTEIENDESLRAESSMLWICKAAERGAAEAVISCAV